MAYDFEAHEVRMRPYSEEPVEIMAMCQGCAYWSKHTISPVAVMPLMGVACEHCGHKSWHYKLIRSVSTFDEKWSRNETKKWKTVLRNKR